MGSREMHEDIKRRIEEQLGSRTWSWLANASGVPQSTLASQAARPKFSLDVLVKLASALDVNVALLLPDWVVTPGKKPPGRAAASATPGRTA